MPYPPQKRRFDYFHRPLVASTAIVIGAVFCCFGLLLLAGYHSQKSLSALTTGNISEGVKSAQLARPIVNTFNRLTFKLIPDLKLWQTALQLPDQLATLLDTSALIAQNPFNASPPNSLQLLIDPLQAAHASTAAITDSLPKTHFIQYQVPSEFISALPFVQTGLEDMISLLNFVSKDQQTWVLLLQNSDELRATGGFPGSYVLLHLQDGIISELVVEDIYDADGQFQGYIPAPAGIREYTSGNRGLRLPDANWWPDFPQSAQTMLQFFALGDKSNIAGVVAINLRTAEVILEITGPLWLPDYNIEVNSTNVGEVLRAERAEFFPGSSQKKHLLSQTLTQLKQKLSKLDKDTQLHLVQALLNQASEKEIQVFSTRPEIQEIFSRYKVTGELVSTPSPQTIQLALVESNVGINKVNKYVDRNTAIEITDAALSVSTTFTNNAAALSATELSALLDQPVEAQPRNGNGYLNYYRLLISPEFQLKRIMLNGEPISTWDEELVTTSSGATLKQIGMLMATAEQQTRAVQFDFAIPSTAPFTEVALYKQAGVPPTFYTVTYPDGSLDFQLSKDTSIVLP